MEVQEALDRISEIHEHMSKGEMYRGFRAWAMGATGLVSILAATLQPPACLADPRYFVFYWIGVAVLAAMIAASEVALNYATVDNPYARASTRRAVGQLLPPLTSGAMVTGVFLISNPDYLLRWLPALWSIFFSLGIFASRPYLPRAIGWVGLWYLLSGAYLLTSYRTMNLRMNPWDVGAIFGIGQLAAALVLYWNLERTNGETR